MTDDHERLSHLVQLLTDQIHQSQRQQQSLINALSKAKAELAALDGGVIYLDGELLNRG
jgi:hypothetical protein